MKMDNQLELYKSIIDDAVDAIFVGDEKGNFIVVNKSAEQLTGYTRDELLDLNMSNLFPQKILTKSPLKYNNLDSSQVITSEREIVRKDGTFVLVEMKSKKLDSGNYQSFIRDISERKQKENELKYKDNRYKTLFELSPTGILLEDSDGTIIDANPAIHKNFGYEGKSLIGKNIKDIVPPDTHDEVQNNIKKIISGESLKHIVQSIKKGGSELYNELYETKISLPEIGDGILSISNDITKQVLAEQKLKASELNYKELFKYATIPFLEEDVTELFDFYDELNQNGITDIRKHFDNNPNLLSKCINKIKPIKINQAGLNLFGFKNIEDYKNNFETIFTPESLKVFKEQIITFSKGIKTFSAETETVTSSGEKKYLIMKIQLRPKTESGRQIELFSLLDITKRKNAELALEESKQQLELAIEGSNLGLWDWQIKTNKLVINERWANIIGYTLEELQPVGFNTWVEKTHTEDLEQSNKLLKNHFSGKTPIYEFETRMKHKLGNWIWILDRGKVVEWDEEGKPIRMVGTHLDITERKKNNELLLKYTQEVETLFHLSEEMVGNLNISNIIKAIPKYMVHSSSNTQSASMWRYNEYNNYFEIVSNFGYGKRNIDGYTLPKENTIIGEIFESKRTIICNDTAKDQRYKKETGSKNLNTKATLGVPLISENKVSYIIFADNFSTTNVFNDNDIKVLQSFANMATIAINNSQLYNKIIESEDKYRSIFDTSGESIFIHDVETGRILDVNNKMLETYGFTYKEALQLKPNNISSCIYPYTPEEIFKYLQKVKTEGPKLFEWHAKKKNGELFWVEVNLQKAKIANDERIVAVVRDITERKFIEDAIKESEAKIQSIMLGAPVGIGFIKNRILEFVNNHLLTLMGYEKEEMIGKDSKIFYESLEHYDKIGNLYAKLQNNEIASEESRIKNKLGKVIDIIITLSPIDKDDLTKGLVFTALDITEKKKYERQIKLEQLRYKNLFENSPVPLWEEDFTEVYSKIEELKSTGVSDIRKYFDEDPERIYEFVSLPIVLNVNQATLDLHNAKEKKELLGSLHNIFSKKSMKMYEEEMIALFNGKKYFETEGEVRTLDNKPIFLDIRLYVDCDDSSNTIIYKALLATIDITERKNEERIKRELEVSYYDIFNNSSDAIYVQDKNGCFLEVNKGVFEMYGYTKEELIGNTPKMISADGKNDLGKISTYIKEAFNGKPCQFEFWGKRKNGEIFPKLVRIKKGSYLGQDVVIAFALDITDQKNYEQELKRWEDVFKHSKWGVVVGSAYEKKLGLMNPAFAEMHGYTIEELKEKSVEMLFTPKERVKIPSIFKEAYEKGSINFETEHLRKDGSSFPIFANVSATKDEKGNLLHRIVNIHDITELKEAEKVIERERDQAQKYLDVAGVLLGVLDVNGTITLMNKKGLKILGYKEKELIGKNWFEIALQKDYVNEVKKVFTKIMSGKLKNMEYYENPIITKSGDVKTIAFHNTVLRNYNSEIIGVLFSGEDITLQKEAIKNLKKSKEEMDELAQHLQDIREEERHGIATEIHDDLGQTLTALKLDTSILLSKLPDADPEIIKKLFSMKNLTDHTIKTVQKISSELRPGILDDLGLCAALEWEIGKFEERTSIKCKLKLTPTDISFDKQLNVTIFRLFQESLTNVARHAKATKLDVKIIQKLAKITMSIKDNGIGITTEQANNHKSFGLVGMRERLKKIGGGISFTSEPNKGTTVKIVIPFLSEDT
ncbi:MAG: PAS domain S-box protein [Ignavibacteriae bacterium]|nr:PAS domain S-box protein [Ignavibacteriota bacterium]